MTGTASQPRRVNSLEDKPCDVRRRDDMVLIVRGIRVSSRNQRRRKHNSLPGNRESLEGVVPWSYLTDLRTCACAGNESDASKDGRPAEGHDRRRGENHATQRT